MNRDCFTTPIQGGRTVDDYGNTHLGASTNSKGVFTIAMAGTMASVLAVALIWLGQNIDMVLGWL